MGRKRTENSRRKHSLRKRAGEAMHEVLCRTDNLCHWCRNPARSLRSIPPGSFIGEENGFINWLEGNTLRRERKATVDHLVPISVNDDLSVNDPNNLVIACIICNKLRRSKYPTIPKTVLNLPHCFLCGGPKVLGRESCETCHPPPASRLTYRLGDAVAAFITNNTRSTESLSDILAHEPAQTQKAIKPHDQIPLAI